MTHPNPVPDLAIQWKQSTMCSVAQVIFCIGLLLVLGLGLIPALLAGLLVYHMVSAATPLLGRVGILPGLGSGLTLLFIAAVVAGLITLGIIGLISLLNGDSGGLISLLGKLADIVDTARERLPGWIQVYLPSDVQDLQAAIAEGLRDNASSLGTFGKGIGISLVYIIIGMVIGGLIAFSARHKNKPQRAPLAHELVIRADMLTHAFRRIVFSQVKISAINAILTGIFLTAILPLMDINLPLKNIIIVVTFLVGLLPVIGNLISNTIIVLVALGISPFAAIICLLFLVIIHKLEYFLNAHIIGTNIRSRAWELLLAMLMMETAFGIEGLIAAPIYYAYLKDELALRKLI